MTQTQRVFLATGAAALVTLAAPVISGQSAVQRNVPALQKIDWRDYFDALGVEVIVADTNARAAHFWGGDGETYRLYPSSVPVSEELTRLRYTAVEGPT